MVRSACWPGFEGCGHLMWVGNMGVAAAAQRTSIKLRICA